MGGTGRPKEWTDGNCYYNFNCVQTRRSNNKFTTVKMKRNTRGMYLYPSAEIKNLSVDIISTLSDNLPALKKKDIKHGVRVQKLYLATTQTAGQSDKLLSEGRVY